MGFLPGLRIRRAVISDLKETSRNQDGNHLGKFLGRSFGKDETFGLAGLPELAYGGLAITHGNEESDPRVHWAVHGKRFLGVKGQFLRHQSAFLQSMDGT